MYSEFQNESYINKSTLQRTFLARICNPFSCLLYWISKLVQYRYSLQRQHHFCSFTIANHPNSWHILNKKAATQNHPILILSSYLNSKMQMYNYSHVILKTNDCSHQNTSQNIIDVDIHLSEFLFFNCFIRSRFCNLSPGDSIVGCTKTDFFLLVHSKMKKVNKKKNVKRSCKIKTSLESIN